MLSSLVDNQHQTAQPKQHYHYQLAHCKVNFVDVCDACKVVLSEVQSGNICSRIILNNVARTKAQDIERRRLKSGYQYVTVVEDVVCADICSARETFSNWM